MKKNDYKSIIDDIIQKYSYRYKIYTNCRDHNSWCDIWNFTIYFREFEYTHPTDVSLLILLHEIGHLETNLLDTPQCEKEFLATQWAIDKMKSLLLLPPVEAIQEYQTDIWNKCCTEFPKDKKKRKELTLIW